MCVCVFILFLCNKIFPTKNKHSHRPLHNHHNRNKTSMRHIHTFIVSMHLATSGNNKIVRTHPQHINKKYIQPYLHKVFAWTKQNTLLLNPDKTTCTLFTPDPAEYTSNLDLTINNKALPMATHPNVLGLTLDPKLTYSTHIHNISVQAHKPLQIIKALTATGWGKQKETLMATIKQL